MIAAASVVVTEDDERRRAHVAEPVRALEVVARDDDVDELRELRVRRPRELEECLDFVGVALAIILGEKGVGLADLVAYGSLEPETHELVDGAVRQAGDAV